jgi:hypothetical protein
MNFQKHCTCASSNLRRMWEIVSDLDKGSLDLAEVNVNSVDEAESLGMRMVLLQRELHGLVLQTHTLLEMIGLEEPSAKGALKLQLDDVMNRFKTIIDRNEETVLRLQAEKRVAQGAPLS